MSNPETLTHSNQRLGVAIYKQRNGSVIRCRHCHLGFIVKKSSWAARKAIAHAQGHGK
jgi:hypothetical protein